MCSSFVAEVCNLDLYNCQNTEYFEAHRSKAKRATVCLYAIGIIFVLISFGDHFVKKSVVTTLMAVGNDGPAFKDAVKILKHSGVILDDNRAKFRFTKSWLDKVNLQFTFNHSTPECKQDVNFCAWMARLNQAILRNPDPEGVAVDSETETEENNE